MTAEEGKVRGGRVGDHNAGRLHREAVTQQWVDRVVLSGLRAECCDSSFHRRTQENAISASPMRRPSLYAVTCPVRAMVR